MASWRGSTCVANIDYDEKTQTLDVTFVKRGSHTYTDVSKELAESFISAGSKGQFFNSNIRPLDP
jgi:hypothetical protein